MVINGTHTHGVDETLTVFSGLWLPPADALQAPKDRSAKPYLGTTADPRARNLFTIHVRLGAFILQAWFRHTIHARGYPMRFNDSGKVWLSTRPIYSSRPSKKLYYEHAEPFEVIQVISPNDYGLDLPNITMASIFLYSTHILRQRQANGQPNSSLLLERHGGWET